MSKRLQISTAAVFLCFIALLAACDTSEVPPTIPIMQPTATPEGAQSGSDPTPAVTSEMAPTREPWLGEVLEPGPAFAPPEQIFFQNGTDVWLLDSEQNAQQLTTNRRIGHLATAPDGSRAALITRTELGSRAAEELVLISPDGSISEPLYGPSVVTGPGANPRVESLVWSPNGAKLALLFDDGSVTLLTVNEDGSPGDSITIAPQEEGRTIRQLAWSPDATAAALLTTDESGVGRIILTSADGTQETAIETGRSYGAVAWLASRARIAAAENRGVPANAYAGSIFSLQPDGSSRDLLVSAGRFAPVVDILQLTASPDGHWLAFGVYTPGPEGEPEFQSLWTLNLETSEFIQVPVQNNLRVTDVWWSPVGLIWRGVDEDAPAGDDITEYTGTEPFLISLFDLAERQTRVIFQGGVQQ